MRAVGMTRKEIMIAKTGAQGLKNIATKSGYTGVISGAGLDDEERDPMIAYLVIDGVVYGSNGTCAIRAADAFIEYNENEDEIEEMHAVIKLATSKAGREYIAVNLV